MEKQNQINPFPILKTKKPSTLKIISKETGLQLTSNSNSTKTAQRSFGAQDPLQLRCVSNL